MIHICISNLTIIDSDNGLSPGRRQAIIRTNAEILLIEALRTNFSEILIGNIFIRENAFENVVCEMAAILPRPQCVKIAIRAATSTDFCNRLTGPPKSNRIRLTERFASPYGALCFHVFAGSDSPPGPSRLSWQFASLLVSNQTSFTQIKRQSKTITCDVLMHKKQISNLMSFTHRVIKNKAR